MTHTITQGPHANIKIVEMTGQLHYEDMMLTESLGLDKGAPLYILIDVSQMNIGLPEDFLDGAKNSFFIHENTAHVALVLESNMLKIITTMVAKVTRRKDKVTIYKTREEALSQLENLVAEAGL